MMNQHWLINIRPSRFRKHWQKSNSNCRKFFASSLLFSHSLALERWSQLLLTKHSSAPFLNGSHFALKYLKTWYTLYIWLRRFSSSPVLSSSGNGLHWSPKRMLMESSVLRLASNVSHYFWNSWSLLRAS